MTQVMVGVPAGRTHAAAVGVFRAALTFPLGLYCVICKHACAALVNAQGASGHQGPPNLHSEPCGSLRTNPLQLVPTCAHLIVRHVILRPCILALPLPSFLLCFSFVPLGYVGAPCTLQAWQPHRRASLHCVCSTHSRTTPCVQHATSSAPPCVSQFLAACMLPSDRDGICCCFPQPPQGPA